MGRIPGASSCCQDRVERQSAQEANSEDFSLFFFQALVFLVMTPFSDHFKMDAYVEMPASVPEQPGEQLSEEPA